MEDAINKRSATTDKTGVGTTTFSKVQFIGIAISTTPSGLTSIDETSDDGYYAGIVNEKSDIQVRISFIKDALSKTMSDPNFDNDTSTLKIIVFPEFLMRGPRGAYSYSHLLPYIQQILQLSERQDILLFIGSILSADQPPTFNSDFYYTGDNLLDIYYRLHSDKMARQSLHNLLKRADGKIKLQDTETDDAFDDILIKVLDYSDMQAKQVISNKCYVVSESFCHTVLKQYKSKEDFILNTHRRSTLRSEIGPYPMFLQTTTKYAEITESHNLNSSVFTYGGIHFGVEICLDHKRQRLKNADVYPVDIQIIPSCGMTIHPESVVVKDGGFVFNCDGEYELDQSAAVKGVNGKNSHTSLCQLSGSSLSEAAATISNQTVVIGEDSAYYSLYPNKEYNIHIYKTFEIK